MHPVSNLAGPRHATSVGRIDIAMDGGGSPCFSFVSLQDMSHEELYAPTLPKNEV